MKAAFFQRMAVFCVLVAMLIASVSHRAAADPVGTDGAVGVNIAWEAGTSADWYVELQRQGADCVRDGVQQKNAALIKSGLTILNWGFAHQASDGSFPGTAGGSTGQMFHSTAIFLDAAAKATLQLRDFDPTTYAAFITGCTAHLQAAADWMLLPDVAAAGQAYNARFTHRRYMLASALAQIGALVADKKDKKRLTDTAAQYAKAGIALMMPSGSRTVITHREDWSVPASYLLTPAQPNPPKVDGHYARGTHVLSGWGINPELNGYDVSYQMVGVQYAERYYPFCTDHKLQAQIADMIEQACLWEISRINGDGDVLIIGSSRVGVELNRAGVTKVTNPYSIKTVLLDGCAITGDSRLRDAALRINTSD